MSSKIRVAEGYRKEISAVLGSSNILSKDQRSSVLAAVDKLVGLLEVAIQEAGELKDVREDIAGLSRRLGAISGLPVTAVASSGPAQLKESKKVKANKGAMKPAAAVSAAAVQVMASPSIREVTSCEAAGGSEVDDVPFVTVTRRKHLTPAVDRSANSSSRRLRGRRNSKLMGSGMDSELKTSQPYKFMHIFYVDNGTDEKSVESYLKKKISVENVIVERLSTGRQYASFKIGVPVGSFDLIMKAEFRPAGIGFDKWFFRRSKGGTPTGEIKK